MNDVKKMNAGVGAGTTQNGGGNAAANGSGNAAQGGAKAGETQTCGGNAAANGGTADELQEVLAKAGENMTGEVKRLLFSCIDYTTLHCTDNEESVLAFVDRVNRWDAERPDLPHVAAVCVYPCFAGLVSTALQVSGVGIAAVCGGFPASQTFMEVKVAEVALAVADGADEIDVVLPVGRFLAGDSTGCVDEVRELKGACRGAALKVILETGVLSTAARIEQAAALAMAGGADFIKTSTGKEGSVASPAAVWAMCRAARSYYEREGRRVGIKVAGGVRTVKQAVEYYTIIKEVLGQEWLSPELLRIGSSGLGDVLWGEISK